MQKPVVVSKTYENRNQEELLTIISSELKNGEGGVVTHKISHKVAKDEDGEKFDLYKLVLTRDYTK